jgi:hypothetical protein
MDGAENVNIRFEYDEEHDLYVIYPCCALNTDGDVRAWAEAYETFFRPLGRRVDCIFVLDMFSVSAAVGVSWQRYRAHIHENYTRHTVRVFMAADQVALIAGSSTAQECCTSIDAAVAKIERDRRAT